MIIPLVKLLCKFILLFKSKLKEWEDWEGGVIPLEENYISFHL